MELYTADGLRVQRAPAPTDATHSTELVLDPAEGPLLVTLYRLCLRLHHAGDDTVLPRGTAALKGAGDGDALVGSAVDATNADASHSHVWSLSAAGASGVAASHAAYAFYLLPQPASSPPSGLTAPSANRSNSRQTSDAPLSGWVSSTGEGGAHAAAVFVQNTNGAAKGIDDIPLRLSLSATNTRRGGFGEEVHAHPHEYDGGSSNSLELALPVLQLESTQRVLACAPIVGDRSFTSGGMAPAEQVPPTLLLCCTATKTAPVASRHTA